ncbi:MAG: UTP--glucose-1-phosphate uridylyltransferase [Candidatus Doudnabacteria bacterium CG10_big_fil_rev_8_21_14_0_10_41_10]|uniref:UTP--glucose-1-phosphate uridylyltransferase n=1 Tax=Candidatus Doudnabacteria bacterium CG10_big_fil_rev_8_21_14_0_10_41_10 TaxID=1974551 RepID=A0A2H0VCP0_9BACT|nr:MAG: UTP--glucose-1-phosphate uridylyltransferase [Candidatus Doudnabacteria bacterium CG10_big_fil_rev_8_21_14_0_10_41_10]
MKKVQKLIIPVAGLGTRFLPVTKALPKEMLPILDKPIVQYIVEEAVASGIKDIILVTGQNKRAIEDHFDYQPELEQWLKKTKKQKRLKQIRDIAKLANFIYIRQKGPYGNGTPILNAKHLISDEPFAVAWGDDVFVSKKPRIKQLIEAFDKYQSPILTGVKTDVAGTTKYGMIEGEEVEKGIVEVSRIKEKPGPKNTKSRIGSIGGYILTPDIFPELVKTPLRDNELWLTDAIARLMKKRKVFAKQVDAEYYDLGSKFGLLKANINFGLRDKEIRSPLKSFLKKNC